MYRIPDNYTNKGRLLNGMLKTRNTIEAVIVLYLGFYLDLKVLANVLSARAKVAVAVVVILPLAIACLIGVGDDSLTQRLVLWRKFKKNKRKLHYSVSEEANTNVEPANSKKKKQPSPRPQKGKPARKAGKPAKTRIAG